MGVAIPLGYVEDRSSGALVVDGSLRFDGSKTHYLSRTFSAGNRKTWTWAGWVKRSKLNNGSGQQVILAVNLDGTDTGELIVFFHTTDQIYIVNTTTNLRITNQVFRDVSAWYHIVIAVDTTVATANDRMKIYVNGAEATFGTISNPSQNSDTGINSVTAHNIGRYTGGSLYLDSYLADVYFIDGQALDASYFGYTDALTNTWRPKKLSSSVAFGTNGFYLPFDGSAPIGQDQSGRGNNWTPVNFGGSNTLEKATGALPILNTDGGGKVARVGVRTDSSASSLVLALPLVGVKDDVSNRINSGSTTKTVTATNAVASSAQSNFYGGSFYFDGSGDYLNAGTSTDFVFGTGQFTIEGWIYNQSYNGSNGGTGDSYPTIISTYSGETVNWIVRIYRTGALTWYSPDGGGTNNNSAGGLTQLNTWYHFAYVREGTGSNQFKMYLNGVLVHTLTDSNNYTANETVVIGSQSASNPRNYHTGYLQDLRIYKGLAKYTQNFIPASTDPDILPDTPSGVSYTSNLTQITDGAVAFDGSGDYLSLPNDDTNFRLTGDFTIELFVYAPTISASSGYAYVIDYAANGSDGWGITFYNNQLFAFFDYGANGPNAWGPSSSTQLNANQWYHIAWTRQSNVHYYYINGKKYTGATQSFSAPSSSSSNVLNIGRFINNSSYFTGLISNIHVVNGTAIYTTDFTPPTGPISSVANTKLLCCKSNSSATAFDVSPGTITANGNAAATNFNPFTVNINTQRGKQSGWCTLNPLDIGGGTLSNGNLDHTYNSSNIRVKSTISIPTTGKWYAEFVASNAGGGNSLMGVATAASALTGSNWYLGNDAGSWGLQVGSGTMYTYHNGGFSSFGTANNGDVIAVAVDRAAGKIWWAVNNIWIAGGDPVSGTNARYTNIPSTDGLFFAISNANNSSIACNFGQKPFRFPPPAGFQPLALANTPRPTIVRPDQYVGIVTYYAADAVAGIATGLSFKPDLVWVKSRTSARSNVIVDSVRGTNSVLWTNLTDAQLSSSQYVSQFNSNGFNYGVAGDVTNNSSLVGWCWKAGGNSNTYNINDVGYATASAAGLTAGTITPTGASVNTKSGFSIVSWTATGSVSTLSHGLGAKPKLIINKPRTGTYDWAVITDMVSGNLQYLYLNSTQAINDTGWGTNPTSSVMSVYSYSDGLPMISYCWAEIPGFSKFGTYTGNASADGPMVYLGFRPRFVIIKCSSTSNAYTNWDINDSARNTYNAADNTLCANLSDQENSGNIGGQPLDFLANGFKIRQATSSSKNLNNATYIYAAFAETPTQNLYGAQANAR